MISSPGCVCLRKRHSRRELDAHLDDLASGDARDRAAGASVRLIPGCCASATCSAKLLVTISTATAMIRGVFMWISFCSSICVSGPVSPARPEVACAQGKLGYEQTRATAENSVLHFLH